MPIRYDTQPFAVTTTEGWVRDAPILTRSGIFPYMRSDGKIVREYRPPEEVFHEDSLPTLLGVPITVEHPKLMKADTPATIIGTVISQGRRDGDNLRADVVIHRPQQMGDRRELSLGYSVEIDETPGEINGQRYDAIQRKIRINHLAVVKAGRAGNARLRLDSAGDEIHPTDDERDDNMELTTVRIDGIEYKVPPQVAKELEKQNARFDAEKSRADKADAAVDTLKSENEKLKKDVETARMDGASSARERLALEAAATKAGVEFKADATDRQIKEAVITKVRGADFRLDGKSDGYIDAAFDLAAQDGGKADGNARSQSQEANKGATPRADAKGDKPKVASASDARRAMISSLHR